MSVYHRDCHRIRFVSAYSPFLTLVRSTNIITSRLFCSREIIIHPTILFFSNCFPRSFPAEFEFTAERHVARFSTIISAKYSRSRPNTETCTNDDRLKLNIYNMSLNFYYNYSTGTSRRMSAVFKNYSTGATARDDDVNYSELPSSKRPRLTIKLRRRRRHGTLLINYSNDLRTGAAGPTDRRSG